MLARADQHAGAERRVHLVGGCHQKIEMAGVAGRTDVDAAVRGELGRVDQDQGAVAVRQLGQLVERVDVAGDVGCAADRQQLDPLAVLRRTLRRTSSISSEPSGRSARCTTVACARQGRSLEWCSISESRTTSSLLSRDAPGGLVDRLGGVLDEDDHLAARCPRRRNGPRSRVHRRTLRWRSRT